VKAMEEALKCKLNISDECHFAGALGAALFAMDHIQASRTPRAKMEESHS